MVEEEVGVVEGQIRGGGGGRSHPVLSWSGLWCSFVVG